MADASQSMPGTSQSGMTAAVWELTQLLEHLRTEPSMPYYVDNLVVRRMIRQLLQATTPEVEDCAGPSTHSATLQGDEHGTTAFIAPNTEVLRLQGQVDGLRTMVAQVHGDLGTLHRELLWTRLELVNVLGLLQEQTDRHTSLFRAATDLVTIPDPIPFARIWDFVQQAILEFAPRPIAPLFPRVRNRLAQQDQLFEDMAVDSDSEGELAPCHSIIPAEVFSRRQGAASLC